MVLGKTRVQQQDVWHLLVALPFGSISTNTLLLQCVDYVL